MIRKPIVAFLGHVDSGKTSLQDFIRQSTMTEREAGLITQHIGASSVPVETIKRICGDLIAPDKDLGIPGLLFIDTPGHEAFTSLRKRGGSLADIAILVVNINEGFMPQTIESVKILMENKTPFVIAANKIDMVSGWMKAEGGILQKLSKQSKGIQEIIQNKIYEIVGSLSKFNIQSERFDRVDDYTKQIAIVPTSAKTGEGMAELLMVLSGLTQKYLSKHLECNEKDFAKGTVLEVKEEKGLGKTLDVIIYDGCLRKGDNIIIGGLNEAIVTKVKALLEPAAMSELRDKKSKFKHVPIIYAAAGIKISAVGLDDAVAGMPIIACASGDIQNVKTKIEEEVQEVLVETEDRGIIVKSDALGSLEALSNLLKKENIDIRKASIGNITKKDIADAESSYESDPLKSVIVGFNIKLDEGVNVGKVKIIIQNVVYKLVDDLKEWQEKRMKELESKELDTVTRPAKVELLQGYVFRQSNPAIVGVEVSLGEIKTGMHLMNLEGKRITEIKGIQADKDSASKAEKGKQVALSLPHVMVGRQIKEGDFLYSALTENEFRKLKEFKKYLSEDEKQVMREIAELKRRVNPVWGV
ncbi:MAG: translation initiation factor IF-2 [Nanoarchaeota archaeon]|nr:translation initiation factor IF-2 [Nanoarchaeota archaeon]